MKLKANRYFGFWTKHFLKIIKLCLIIYRAKNCPPGISIIIPFLKINKIKEHTVHAHLRKAKIKLKTKRDQQNDFEIIFMKNSIPENMPKILQLRV